MVAVRRIAEEWEETGESKAKEEEESLERRRLNLNRSGRLSSTALHLFPFSSSPVLPLVEATEEDKEAAVAVELLKLLLSEVLPAGI